MYESMSLTDMRMSADRCFFFGCWIDELAALSVEGVAGFLRCLHQQPFRVRPVLFWSFLGVGDQVGERLRAVGSVQSLAPHVHPLLSLALSVRQLVELRLDPVDHVAKELRLGRNVRDRQGIELARILPERRIR